MQVEIEYIKARTARARVIEGVLRVRMPSHWPQAIQEQMSNKLLRWAQRHIAKQPKLEPLAAESLIEWRLDAFDRYVRRLNDETLQVPLAAVRIGAARRSRLAQANTRTRVLTFSCHAITGMPEQALRYLILHELAHLKEANHSPRFWALVAAFEPDYKRQRAIAIAHHSRMIDRLEKQERDPLTAPIPIQNLPEIKPTALAAPSPLYEGEGHLFGPLFAFVPHL